MNFMTSVSSTKMDYASHYELIWKLTLSGAFSVKSFYGHLIAGEVNGGDFPAKKIWKAKATPRVALFCFYATKECILTLEKLVRRR